MSRQRSALFLGTLAASQAVPIIEFITTDIRTEILDSNEPTQAAAALTDSRTTGTRMAGSGRQSFVRMVRVRTREMRGRSRYPDNQMVRRGPMSCPNALPKPYVPRARLVGRTRCSIAL